MGDPQGPKRQLEPFDQLPLRQPLARAAQLDLGELAVVLRRQRQLLCLEQAGLLQGFVATLGGHALQQHGGLQAQAGRPVGGPAGTEQAGGRQVEGGTIDGDPGRGDEAGGAPIHVARPQQLSGHHGVVCVGVGGQYRGDALVQRLLGGGGDRSLDRVGMAWGQGEMSVHQTVMLEQGEVGGHVEVLPAQDGGKALHPERPLGGRQGLQHHQPLRRQGREVDRDMHGLAPFDGQRQRLRLGAGFAAQFLPERGEAAKVPRLGCGGVDQGVGQPHAGAV